MLRKVYVKDVVITKRSSINHHIYRMKKITIHILLSAFLLLSALASGQSNTGNKQELKIVFMRHGEKPEKGGNLTCKGLNRSLQLPAMITQKFGIPDYTYVPKLAMGDKTSHARMFETVIPLAVKYNLVINSKYDEKDFTGLAAELKGLKGTVLVVWEHSAIAGVVQALGIGDELKWGSDDYDSIWIVSFIDGKAKLSMDKEGLNPSNNCP
jgi:hypothetical protein